MTRPKPHDIAFARIIAWLKARKLEAHTDLRGNTRVIKRQPRRSRLTGEAR